jgi:outer membrane protein TolC
MKTLNISLLFIISIVLYPVNALTLTEAQEILLKNNRELASVRYSIEKHEFAIKETQALYHPSLTSSATYTYFSKKNQLSLSETINTPMGDIPLELDKELGDNDRAEIGIDIAYPIFTGTTRRHLVTNKRHALEAEKLRYKSIKNSLLFSMAVTYIQWHLAAEKSTLHEELCSSLRDELNRTQVLFNSGINIQADVLRAEAELAKAEFDKSNARSMIDSLQYELCKILGISDNSIIPEEYSLVNLIDMSNHEFNDARFELSMLDENVSQLLAMQKATIGRRLPTAATFAGLRVANPGLNMTGDEFMTYGLVGLKFSWDIYDGFANKMQRRGISSQISSVEEKREAMIHQWKIQMDQAQLMVKNTAKMREAAEKVLEAASTFCENIKEAVEAGTAVSTDYLKATIRQNEAELALQQIQAAEDIARLRLVFAAGHEIDFSK